MGTKKEAVGFKKENCLSGKRGEFL